MLDVLEESAREHGLKRITRVEVVVGELAGIVPEALEFAFAALAPLRGTMFAGAELMVERRQAMGRCQACGSDFSMAAGGFRCPSCGDGRAHMYQGDEFLLAAYQGER